jgi:aerobic carbon-monoxide dehydrogenase medium subunit
MYPSNFRYHRATSFAEASATLLSLGDKAQVMAGGQTLIPMMKLRLIKPSDVIDLAGIADASGIVERGGTIRIGALARHAVIGASATAARYAILRDCALGIADAQIRNMGTIGGSLAEADPCSCWPALLVALDARVLCAGPSGTREQSVRTLLADAYTPNLEPGELISEIVIDATSIAGFGTFVAFKRCAPAYPTASCALGIAYDGDRVAKLRMGFGCLGLTPLALDQADDVARGRAVNPELIDEVAVLASESVEPIEDNKGSVAYKRSLVRGLVRRAFAIVEHRRRGQPATETHFYYG